MTFLIIVILNYCHSKLLSFPSTDIPNIVITNYFRSELVLSFQTTVISNYCHFEYPNETTYCLLVLKPLLSSASSRHCRRPPCLLVQFNLGTLVQIVPFQPYINSSMC